MIDSSGPVGRRVRQPVFNLPGVIVGLAAVLFGVHAVRSFVLTADHDAWLVTAFAFIPLRETLAEADVAMIPGGMGARIWTFVTYAVLHADWGHLLVNGVWLAAFGSALAWRFGTVRFLLFSAIGASAGAAAHLLLFPKSFVPMVGASAAISAHMAAASRFIFSGGRALLGSGGAGRFRQPAPPLSEIVTNRRVLVFLAAWFALNLLFGLMGAGTGLASGAVAWDAHIGGFLAGLLLFPIFDPIGTANR
jgi:membrane associated rhomboid family serine protease